MKLALFALASFLSAQAAPTKCATPAAVDDGNTEGIVSLPLTFVNAPPVDDEPRIVHKAANVPHDVPVTDWARELLYSTQIKVGTPPQTISVHLDTGSGDLAIWNGDNCTMAECNSTTNQPQFHPSKSSTYKLMNATARPYLGYGIGFSSGDWAQDKVELGGFTQEHQNFLSQSAGETGYEDLNVTGLLGMGFADIAKGKEIKTNWLANAIVRFKQPMFSFYLQHTPAEADGVIPNSTGGGVLTLGGVNKKFYKGKITYTSVQGNPKRFWEIPAQEVKFNDQVVSNGTARAIIDTGTSLVYGPPDIVRGIYDQLPGAILSSGMYLVPCNTSATLTFKFSGREWTIPPKDFLYTESKAMPSMCYGSLVPQPGNLWLIGDAFLKNVYSVFKWKPAQVGFAELRV